MLDMCCHSAVPHQQVAASRGGLQCATCIIDLVGAHFTSSAGNCTLIALSSLQLRDGLGALACATWPQPAQCCCCQPSSWACFWHACAGDMVLREQFGNSAARLLHAHIAKRCCNWWHTRFLCSSLLVALCSPAWRLGTTTSLEMWNSGQPGWGGGPVDAPWCCNVALGNRGTPMRTRRTHTTAPGRCRCRLAGAIEALAPKPGPTSIAQSSSLIVKLACACAHMGASERASR